MRRDIITFTGLKYHFDSSGDKNNKYPLNICELWMKERGYETFTEGYAGESEEWRWERDSETSW